MKPTVRTEPQRLTKPAALGLGERLRRLRVAAGLTQGELAGDRFSKEYVSQIERGKTRPTSETVEWLAQRLEVDPAFLSSGVSTDERSRVEALLARAEALSKAYRYKDAVGDAGDQSLGHYYMDTRAIFDLARAEDPEAAAQFEQFKAFLPVDKLGPVTGSFAADGDGTRLVANLRTRAAGYVEQVDVDAVQVTVTVTRL